MSGPNQGPTVWHLQERASITYLQFSQHACILVMLLSKKPLEPQALRDDLAAGDSALEVQWRQARQRLSQDTINRELESIYDRLYPEEHMSVKKITRSRAIAGAADRVVHPMGQAAFYLHLLPHIVHGKPASYSRSDDGPAPAAKHTKTFGEVQFQHNPRDATPLESLEGFSYHLFE